MEVLKLLIWTFAQKGSLTKIIQPPTSLISPKANSLLKPFPSIPCIRVSLYQNPMPIPSLLSTFPSLRPLLTSLKPFHMSSHLDPILSILVLLVWKNLIMALSFLLPFPLLLRLLFRWKRSLNGQTINLFITFLMILLILQAQQWMILSSNHLLPIKVFLLLLRIFERNPGMEHVEWNTKPKKKKKKKN